MTSVAACELCGAPAVARCVKCGRYVCERHYDKKSGLCSACRESLCSLCGERLAVSTCSLCGRLVCRECSVEAEPGIRVCARCYESLGRPPKRLLKELLREPRGMEAAARLALKVLPGPRAAGRSI